MLIPEWLYDTKEFYNFNYFNLVYSVFVYFFWNMT